MNIDCTFSYKILNIFKNSNNVTAAIKFKMNATLVVYICSSVVTCGVVR